MSKLEQRLTDLCALKVELGSLLTAQQSQLERMLITAKRVDKAIQDTQEALHHERRNTDAL